MSNGPSTADGELSLRAPVSHRGDINMRSSIGSPQAELHYAGSCFAVTPLVFIHDARLTSAMGR